MLSKVNTDFTDADIRGVSMEDTSMDGAILKNAIAAGSYFSASTEYHTSPWSMVDGHFSYTITFGFISSLQASIVDAASVENVDFSDAQFPVKSLPLLCDRLDMKGTNPATGVDTRDSALCP
jgi:uncharacterized protein YjbI with pentapeptide repeats